MNKQTCCPIVIFLFVFIYYIFNERLVTNCTMVPTYEYSWDKKTPYFF